MAHFEERTWEPHPGAMSGRRARRSFKYLAFVPDPIAAWYGTLDATADAAVRAPETLARFARRPYFVDDPEVGARHGCPGCRCPTSGLPDLRAGGRFDAPGVLP